MSMTIQLITKEVIWCIGSVYVHSRREVSFELGIEKAHRNIRDLSKESTFLVLHAALSRDWLEYDDVVQPFGDKRENLRSVCSFNLDEDVLYYSDVDGHGQIPLSRLRDTMGGEISRSELVPFTPKQASVIDLTSITPPYYHLVIPVHERDLAFTSHILLDFASQWRHILRSPYADSTFRRFAKAILEIATGEFEVEEVSESQHIPYGRFYVSVLDIPTWEPCRYRVFEIASTTVVLNQDLKAALEIARNDAEEKKNAVKNNGAGVEQRIYLLLSVRHILLCHVDSTGYCVHTSPTPFMDGLTPPSPHAINLLLQALAPSTLNDALHLHQRYQHTRIHTLPLEIQDRILQYIAEGAVEGAVEAARTGCVLGLGTPFTWLRKVDRPRTGGKIALLTSPSHRIVNTPVEGRVCFGGVFSGVSYR
ncbi:hypothetical protein VTL71DRAFT_5671 [Oculimacula yallundae]|uniref:Uncharacterized protein n=1 Tax=Oculimacula yallundae TaxID=86028 RepID=A0ABR4BZU9_9HELO